VYHLGLLWLGPTDAHRDAFQHECSTMTVRQLSH